MPRPNRKDRYKQSEQKGRIAEIIILVIYMAQGFWPVARRYRTKFGEIDLIMKRGHLICFIEVKYRQTPLTHDVPITPKQWQRLSQSAHYFLAFYHRGADYKARFDLAYLSPFFSVKLTKNIIL